uniref:TrmE-type G domain-containing protein n=1 Tax=Candidozyma auris TaxID=498019 RepID=A0A0L0P4A0_CANAR
MFRPTIYALSTRPGRAAIGVIRVSGPHSKYIYHKLTATKKEPLPQKTSVRKLYEPNTKLLLDEALTVFFKAPKTYTGEDLLELHVHGGNAIVKSVVDAIKKLHNPENGIEIRHAEQGEFSQRAFMNGRFDLTEIEGIREMIDADTETQRLAALASLSGDTKRTFGEWRTDIVKNVALLTTIVDFGEEHDLEETNQLFDQVDQNIDKLKDKITSYLNRVKQSEVLLKGIRVSLLGPVNAGKLSLLNYLTNRETAIVSDIAGTTRDVLDVPLDINGYKVIVGDTAGIRSLKDADPIEVEGIRRAKQRALGSDLVLAVIPVDMPVSEALIENVRLLSNSGRPIIAVLNKTDLVESVDAEGYATQLGLPMENIHVVSCKTGQGIQCLRESLTDRFRTISSSEPIILSSRAQDLVENDVLFGLDEFKKWKQEGDVVLALESLRIAADGIGKVTGDTVGVEEILGVVFLSFCIGK